MAELKQPCGETADESVEDNETLADYSVEETNAKEEKSA